MPTLEINGHEVEVDDSFLSLPPEQQNATVDEIAASLPAMGQESEASQQTRESLASMTKGMDGTIESVADERFKRLPEWKKPLVAASDLVDVYGNGLTMGFGNKGAAALRSAFTDKSYAEELAAMKDKTQAARDRAGGAGTAAEIAGAVTGPIGLARRGATLVGRFGTGTMEGVKGVLARAGLMGTEGAAYGGLSAAGNDTDIGTGAALGFGLGAALPVVTAVGSRVAKPVVDAVKARVNPSGYATEKVAERLAASNMTAEQAAKKMQTGGMSLADVGGENTRSLLRTTTNIPGKAQQNVKVRLTLRQFGQGDRLKSAVSKTFADPDGYLAAKDEIADTAKRVAAPLFREAEKTPIHFSETLEGILNTPAGRQALRDAETLAANEQVPFRQLFINIADDGSATVKRVPDQRAWQYIKQAMDDMVDAQTDSITKKVSNPGRIINNLKNRLLEELDAQNPVYAQARKAWGGQQELDKALETGRNIFSMSPEAAKRTVSGMTEAQKASARVGAAEAVRAQIEGAGVTNNSVLRFFSKPSQIKNLRALFESNEKFAEFRKLVFAEARKRSTYEAVKGNSTTARQLADMMETGGLQEGAQFVGNAVKNGPVSATLQWVGSRLRMLGGLTPEVADNIARQLMTTSPQATAQITSELARIGQAQLSAAQRQQAVQALITRSLAVGGGTALAQPQ